MFKYCLCLMEIKIIGCWFDPVAGTAAGPKIINAALDCVLIYFRDGNPTSVELIELFAFTRSRIWHFKVIFPTNIIMARSSTFFF